VFDESILPGIRNLFAEDGFAALQRADADDKWCVVNFRNCIAGGIALAITGTPRQMRLNCVVDRDASL